MTDKENETEIIPKKLSFTSSTSECRSRTTTIADYLAVDIHTSLSSVAPIVNNDTDANDEDLPLFSNPRVYQNLVLLSLAFILLFTAYVGILSLQSSINTKGNVGVNSLLVLNGFTLFGSLFVAGIAIDIFGLKWTIILAEIGYILFICANIRPIPILMYCTASLVGLASACLWTSQATYISCIARYHAHYKQQNVANSVSLFFGIFFAFFGTTSIWGNLISYYILHESNNPQKFNCGIHFDPIKQNSSNQPNEVSEATRYVLCGIFAGMGIVSMLLLLALDQVRLTEPESAKQSLKKSLEVIRSLFQWKNLEQLLLAPMTVWSIIENGFLTTQFTRAFITCLIGIRFIGLVLICNGICNAITNYILGSLAKYIGRIGCFIIAASLNYVTIVLMYLWEPHADQTYILYIISGLWGVAGAAWLSQVSAAYTVLYGETDPSVLAKYCVWKAIGNLVVYGYASYVSIQMTLIILFTVLSLSMICYGIVEIRVRWKNRTETSTMNINDC